MELCWTGFVNPSAMFESADALKKETHRSRLMRLVPQVKFGLRFANPACPDPSYGLIEANQIALIGTIRQGP
jgi:hypothetical protein